MAEEVMPKNILMIGPTGVGKTELARRLAKLANSPFMKVEASKFTEVGYVGRDVESMIRDLVDIAIDMVREEKLDEVGDRAEANAEEPAAGSADAARSRRTPRRTTSNDARKAARAAARRQARRAHGGSRGEGPRPTFEIASNVNIEEMGINIKDMLPGDVRPALATSATCAWPRRSIIWCRKKSRS